MSRSESDAPTERCRLEERETEDTCWRLEGEATLILEEGTRGGGEAEGVIRGGRETSFGILKTISQHRHTKRLLMFKIDVVT